jgi:hypothetical protein
MATILIVSSIGLWLCELRWNQNGGNNIIGLFLGRKNCFDGRPKLCSKSFFIESTRPTFVVVSFKNDYVNSAICDIEALISSFDSTVMHQYREIVDPPKSQSMFKALDTI